MEYFELQWFQSNIDNISKVAKEEDIIQLYPQSLLVKKLS